MSCKHVNLEPQEVLLDESTASTVESFHELGDSNNLGDYLETYFQTVL